MKKLLFGITFILLGIEELHVQTILREDNVENAYPRLSRDGTRILYQSNRSGTWQLYIRSIKDGKEIRITNDKFQNNFPDWSPDNKSVAFVSNRNGNEEIYIMKTDGTDIKQLTNNKARDIHPYFSPDGKRLLFNSTRDDQAAFEIYELDIKTGEVLRLTETPEDETCARYSNDTKMMVFLRNSATSDDVFVKDMVSVVTSNLTKTPRTMDGWPMFSADSQWVYYSAMTNGRYCIFRIRPDGTSKEQLTQAAEGEEHARVYVADKGDFMIYNKSKGSTISIEKAALE